MNDNDHPKDYEDLCSEERANGFVRPYRDKYIHLRCGNLSKMSQVIAETFARDPTFFSGAFCEHCQYRYPVDQFKWSQSDDFVGS